MISQHGRERVSVALGGLALTGTFRRACATVGEDPLVRSYQGDVGEDPPVRFRRVSPNAARRCVKGSAEGYGAVVLRVDTTEMSHSGWRAGAFSVTPVGSHRR